MRWPVKTLIVAALALITVSLMLLDRTHISVDDTQAPEAASLTQTAPDATFALLNGGTVALHSLSGHTVWLHFWASWCVPCKTEFPALLKRLEREGDDTILLAVSADTHSEDARKFIAPYRRDFKTLFDSGKVLVADDPDHKLIEGIFQTFQYPETIIIDRDLSMRRKIIGPMQE